MKKFKDVKHRLENERAAERKAEDAWLKQAQAQANLLLNEIEEYLGQGMVGDVKSRMEPGGVVKLERAHGRTLTITVAALNKEGNWFYDMMESGVGARPFDEYIDQSKIDEESMQELVMGWLEQ